MSSYFSAETTHGTRAFYALLCLITLVYTLVSLLWPLITPKCDIPLLLKDPSRRSLVQGLEGGLEDAPNPSYRPDPCRWRRYGVLLGLNKWEADMCCRVIVSILMGSIIGFERRRADRPAGIRTMAMVCLGACIFTIDSMFAFVDGTMGWDASRVSAAIPSGVGFLGAASIWKGTRPKVGEGGQQVPEVHGLTTATSVWISAGIGLLCGGGLYVPALFATASSVVYLRFAPRLNGYAMEEEEELEAAALEAQATAGTSMANLLGRSSSTPLTEQLLRRDSYCNPHGVERRDSSHSFASNSETPKKPKKPERPSLNV